MDTKDQQLPQATAGDYVHAAAKAVLSLVPMAGGPVAEIFGAILAPPLVRRRDEWFKMLAEALASLKEKVDGFSPESLSSNEAFVSALLQASPAAIKTHQEEKLEALRNALVNIAANRAPDEDIQAVFIGYIDALTPTHIRILKCFENPVRFVTSRGGRVNFELGPVSSILELAFPEFGSDRGYEQFVRDLHTRGLISIDERTIHTVMSATGLSERRTSKLGDRFLSFIAPQ